jgi:aerobic-type carbon monoxide dehydrogenase small subunit (CoxS/CutS family)
MSEQDTSDFLDVSLTVNGEPHQCRVMQRKLLADFLRQDLLLTGTHLGCEHGVCGACTVLVDGVSARSCLMLAVQADGADIQTVESLAVDEATGEDVLHPLQQAFWDRHGLQCGFCTPGILMSLAELLRADMEPTEEDIRLVLSGHLCRCTGYQNIVAAALDAAAAIRAGGRR